MARKRGLTYNSTTLGDQDWRVLFLESPTFVSCRFAVIDDGGIEWILGRWRGLGLQAQWINVVRSLPRASAEYLAPLPQRACLSDPPHSVTIK